MSILAEWVSLTPLRDRIFSERQLGAVLGGSEARRYGLVNRALRDGSLVRVKRGTYVLGHDRRGDAIHPFAVAQALDRGSYVSFESALALHGWIPEAVYATASVSPGRRSRAFDPPGFGRFDFHPLAVADYRFLVAVDRVPLGALTALVAQPLRALLDLVALRRLRWSGTAWLIEGMRIDEELLLASGRRRFAALRPVYKHGAARDFLDALEQAVGDRRAARMAAA